MNQSHFSRFLPVLMALAVAMLACSAPLQFFGVEVAMPTPVADTLSAPLPATPLPVATDTQAAPAPVETATEPAALAPFAVTTEVLKEESSEPASAYIIDIEYPRFSGAPEAAAATLNQQVDAVIARQRGGFDEMVKTPVPAEFSAGPHGFQMRYEVRANDGKYVSIYFQLSLYSSGAAHPLPYSETLTYDVTNQRVLQLADLFQPGVDYLTVLSEKSIASLHSQDITGGEVGAAPLPENYRNWNLTPEGLVITFDPYQVAAYARGFVPITIPWAELSELLILSF